MPLNKQPDVALPQAQAAAHPLGVLDPEHQEDLPRER
jgi:hypothetical protein